MFSYTTLSKKLLAALAVTAALTLSAAAAEVSAGTVDASALNLRSSASSSASVIATAPKGAKVVILEKTGTWFKVSYNYSEGYMAAEYLSPSASADLSAAPLSGIVTGAVVNVRSQPGTSNAVVCQLKKDVSAEVIGINGGWYQVKYGSYIGYIHPDYFQLAKPLTAHTPAAQSSSGSASEGSADPAETGTNAEESADATDLRNQIVEYAKQYIGTRYTSGGRSPSVGFDCSGFVYYVFKNFGYTLTPGASTQMDTVTAISKDQLLPGDLVFFNTGSARLASHVGIYVGNNQFIHAVSYGKTLNISSLSDSYYTRYYVGAGRALS